MQSQASNGPATLQHGPLEPRYFPRVSVEVPVAATDAVGRWAATSRNVSAGGMLVHAAASPAPGSELRVAFDLPGAGPVETAARVVRVSPAAEGNEIALVFADLPKAQDAAIARFLAERGDIAWEDGASRIPRPLALRFIPLIRRAARSLAARLPPQVLVDDLIGAGFVALVELWAQMPVSSVEELERIAMSRVRFAMLDELRRSDPLSRRMRTKTKRVEQTRHELEASLGRHATRAEIAQAAQMTAQAVEDAEGMAHSSSAGAHASLAELDLPDQSAQSPEDDVAHTESIARVRVALDALPPRHRRILELHYGEQLTLREIGNLIGVTEARISQLMANAVQRLKDTCAAPE